MVYQGSYDLRRDVDKLKRKVDDGVFEAETYFIQANTPVVTYDVGYSPSTVTFTSYSNKEGFTELFDCTMMVEGSVDGVTYETLTTSYDVHSIGKSIESSYSYYRGSMLVDDNVLDYQTVRVVSNSDTYSVFLGNESQLVPCDDDGELISSFTFKVPYYCYKGTKKYPCSFYRAGSTIPNWVTYTNRDATASNPGELNITVNSTPSENTGYLVLAFNVDSETIYCILNYARTKEGVKGADGVDGNGYHYIYYRTTTNVKPEKPVFGETIIIDNTQISGEDLTGNEWFEESVTPTSQFPYLWCSFRFFNGVDSQWGAFCEPYLVDNYAFYGSNGKKGNTGLHGVDGTILDGEQIIDKTTDLSSKSMNDSVPSNFVSGEVLHESYNIGGRWTVVDRQGTIVIINLYGFNVRPSSIGEEGYYTLLTLPSWAMPTTSVYFSDAVDFQLGQRYRVNNDNGTPKLSYWYNPDWDGRYLNVAGQVMYFVDDSYRPTTQIDVLSPSHLSQGSPITVQLLDEDDTALGNEKLYFKVNNVIYKRTTNAAGVASLNLNLDYDSRGYEVAVWFDGYNYENDQITTLGDNSKCQEVFTIYMKPAFIRLINFGNDENKGYYTEIRTNTDTPLRYHDLTLSIAGGEGWTTQTDGEGRVYFDLMGYEGEVEVLVTVPESNRVYESVKEKHIFNINTTQVYTHIYYPSSFDANADYNNLDADYVRSINDMKYVESNIVGYNVGLGELKLNYTDLNIPLSATIQSVDVEVKYTGLEGDKQLQRPSWKAPRVKLYVHGSEAVLTGRPSEIKCNYKNTGKWMTTNYSTDLSGSDIGPANISNQWKDISLGFGDLTNYGGGDNHQDSGRFAIDYVELSISYTVDNEQTLITGNIPTTTIYSEDFEMYEKESRRCTARLLNEDEPVADARVIFHMNGNDYIRTTDANGEASVGINQAPGNYAISISYTDDNDATITKIVMVKVKPKIVGNPLTKSFRCTGAYEVTLFNDDGTTAPGETVTFNINGVNYNRTSNEYGIAKININLAPGNYIITAYWLGCVTADEITIYPNVYADDLFMRYRDGSQFIATVFDCNDNPAEGADVIFNINGKFYPRTTDANGEAKLTINLMPGEYIVNTTSVIHDESMTIANKIVVRG